MADIPDRLKNLLKSHDVMTGAEWQSQAQKLEQQRAAGDFEINHIVPGEIIGNEEEGGFYLVRTDFSLDTPHGEVTLGEGLDVTPEHIAFSACDSELEAFDPRTTVFMDTETTGLAGGAGTVPFLIGLGYYEGDAFRLDQCFMRDFDDEEPMLAYLAPLLGRFDTVVSYNGKSFDMPLLRARFIQNRIPFRLDSACHFDLVHAARRFWKGRLGDCSLGNVERSVLGIHRHGDVPSSEIPQIWFDYLRTRDARRLEAVFYHHRMDILSLVALTALLSRNLDLPNGQGFEHATDRFSLLRIHFRQKRYEDVTRLAQDLLDTETDPFIRRESLEMLALAHKRRQRFLDMEQAWETLLDEFPRHLLARLELAKHHEHRTRNLLRAEQICRDAVEFLETKSALQQAFPLEMPEMDGFKRRLDRIRRKMTQGRNNSQDPDSD